MWTALERGKGGELDVMGGVGGPKRLGGGEGPKVISYSRLIHTVIKFLPCVCSAVDHR